MKTIGIYTDPLMVFTSAMPQRGVIKRLVEDRKEDKFIFFVHKKTLKNPVIASFFKQLENSRNWSIHVLQVPYKITKVLQFIGIEYPRLKGKSEVYFSPDFETFGRRAHPVVNYLPDMSVFDDPLHTSLSPLSNFFRKNGISRMSKKSDCIIMISQFTVERFAVHFPEQKHKVRLVHNGIDEEWFRFPKQVVSGLDKYWIWMGGSYNSRKNLDRLLSAYRLLVVDNSHGNIPRLLLVGLDELSINKLTDVLTELSLLKFVTLKPKVNFHELIKLVDNSEGLLFPSIYEGFGLPVIEAFARGKAVLTSDSSSLSEISSGKAILCNPYEIDSIYNALSEMLSGNANEERQVNERKEWASQFTYSEAAGKIYSIFQQLENKPTV